MTHCLMMNIVRMSENLLCFFNCKQLQAATKNVFFLIEWFVACLSVLFVNINLKINNNASSCNQFQ